jgi:hypothetical protein
MGVLTCTLALVPQARVELATFRLGDGFWEDPGRSGSVGTKQSQPDRRPT